MAQSKTQYLKPNKLVVAALDFGTTYSGYAYSFKNDYEKDPMKIYTNTAWNSDGEGLVSWKAPTTVLFNQEGNFHSFGFEAETKYADLANEDVHFGWKYFRRFKMTLFETELKKRTLKRNFQLRDDQGNIMEAIKIFGSAIKYLTNHMVKKIKNSVPDIKETDIFYTLTVPAIWPESAKQFMIEAAAFAGIPSNQLMLALEPEAAAVYCKQHVIQKVRDEQGDREELRSFSPGSQFMVVDIGGGTVDITVHGVKGDGTLEELIPPQGGPWGGTLVDAAFTRFLEELFTKDVLCRVTKESKADELDIYRAFEMKKRMIKASSGRQEGEPDVFLKIPSIIYDIFREIYPRKDFTTALQNSSFKKTVTKKRDKLHIAKSVFVEFFRESTSKVISCIRQNLQRWELRNVSSLLVVGGFSDSELMQTAIREAFPHQRVIIPEEASLAVVKGAVIFGQKPQIITSRKLPFTLGVSVAVPFEPHHLPAHKVVRNGIDMCEDVFKVFIPIGTKVKPGETKHVETLRRPSFVSHIEIYKSERVNPEYVSDCQRIGVLKLDENFTGNDKIIVKFFFDTQLMVTATDEYGVKSATFAILM